MRSTFKLLAAIAACFFVSSFAVADLVNIDFGRGIDPLYVGTGSAPGTGTVWQAFDQGAQTDAALVDEFGALTCVTMSKVGTSAFGSEGGGSPTTHDMMEDYLHDANNGLFDNTVSFSGLIAGNTYTLHLYGHGDQPNQDAEFLVDAANGGATGIANSTVRNPITLGGNYLALTAVADANGTIGYTWGRPIGTGSGHAAHNGVQLEGVFPVKPVPEPSSALFAGLLGLVAVTRRSKR